MSHDASEGAQIQIFASNTMITDRVQKLLDETQGPLRIVFEPGLHLSGGLRLRSDLTLHFKDGAELHFIPSYDAYCRTCVEVEAEGSNRAMMMAQGERNITINGSGRIFADGSRAFSHAEDHEMGVLVPSVLRPRVLVLDQCSDVQIDGLQIDDSPMWTLHFVDCDRLSLASLKIDNNRKMPNTDGVVIDGCRDVSISNCTIRTADDGVVLKTSVRASGAKTGPCAGVRVVDCVIESRSCAIKIGTESFSDFSNIQFERIQIEGSNRAMGIFSRDGGAISNVEFKDITVDCSETPSGFWGSGEALTINTLDRRPEDQPAGRISNVRVRGLTGTMQGAINIVASQPGRIDGVILENIDLEQRQGAIGTGLNYDLRPTYLDRFPSEHAAGRVNAWRLDDVGRVVGLFEYPQGMPGVFVKSVADVVMRDVEVRRPSPLPSGWNEVPVLCVNE